MPHPRYIELNGHLYRIVSAEQEEEKPLTFAQALKALGGLYFKMCERADPEPGLSSILDAVRFARHAAGDVEKKLPDSLRPGSGTGLSGWSLSDEFFDTLKQLETTYKKLMQAYKAADRRRAFQKFLEARGIDVPEAHKV